MKQRIESQDFVLTTDNFSPRSLWSERNDVGIRLADAKLYTYKMSNKDPDGSKDFSGLSRTGEEMEETISLIPSDIWSDEATMQVADGGSGAIYAYDVKSKSRKTNKDGGNFERKLQDLLSGAEKSQTNRYLVGWRNALGSKRRYK